MFHAIMRAKLRGAFRDIDAGRYDRIVPQFAARHEHVFGGEHALAGTRRSVEATGRWYERLARVFPDLRFEITSIVVSGWPWDTRAAVEWRDHFTVDGAPRSNEGVHMFRFAWGRVTSLHVYCDTQKLAAVLAAKAEGGVGEAVAAPIVDAEG
jgi:ketosteroid isomerase-like protein